MNRDVVIERLYMIQDRLNELKKEHAHRSAYTHARPVAAATLVTTLSEIVWHEVRADDYELTTTIGWLAGYASHAGFQSDIAGMCKALEISPEMVVAIEHGDYPRPLDPERLAKLVYETVKGSIQTVFIDKLTKAEAVIIRSKDAPLIDELARNAAGGVMGIIEAERGK